MADAPRQQLPAWFSPLVGVIGLAVTATGILYANNRSAEDLKFRIKEEREARFDDLTAHIITLEVKIRDMKDEIDRLEETRRD